MGDVRSVVNRAVDECLDIGGGFAVDQRSDLGALRRVADRQLTDPGAECFDELLSDICMYVEPVGRCAGLAGVAELRDHRAVCGRINIGVCGDDERGIAAELH